MTEAVDFIEAQLSSQQCTSPELDDITFTIPDKVPLQLCKFIELTKNHLCFHRPLKNQITIDPILFHDRFCPQIRDLRHDMFREASLNQLADQERSASNVA